MHTDTQCSIIDQKGTAFAHKYVKVCVHACVHGMALYKYVCSNWEPLKRVFLLYSLTLVSVFEDIIVSYSSACGTVFMYYIAGVRGVHDA